MPLARIEIEQIEGNRWTAEIEAGGLPGGPNFKRTAARAGDFEAVMAEVRRVYYEQVTPRAERPAAPVLDTLSPPIDDELAALRAQAKRDGVEVDGRWGAARLRQAIDQAAREREATQRPFPWPQRDVP